MSEPILTEDEKHALLEGVSSGAVEVHGGTVPRHASVRRYDIAARSRIVTHGYPRLAVLNAKLAERLAADLAAGFKCELEVRATGLEAETWEACRQRLAAPAVHFPFRAAPLDGTALVVLEAAVVRQLVDAFFGYTGTTAYQGGASFTRGERSVAARGADAILAGLREVWEPVVALSPERVPSDAPLELLDIADDGDPVLACDFELAAGDARGAFHVVWPRAMVASLLPAFEGRQRARDAAADARWQEALRRRLQDVPVRVCTVVGEMPHPVGLLAGLEAGAVLPIANPESATVLAGGVPVVKGRFGVIAGKNAVEATGWLGGDGTASIRHEES
ncbi:MAG TPA: FliM/FliN family flagellar motor switch protein [Woeseiaceae bacterium]|nr:FliM/FliN family flagellar motor switch protein [Woeseiaceae bacterium]